MALAYRHIEVLTVLRENPKGLTTAGVFSACRKKPGSEIPDSVVVSKIIFSMRGTSGYITTSDAVGGAIHKITQKGIEALEKETGNDCQDLVTSKAVDVVESQNTHINLEAPEHRQNITTKSNEVDNFDPLVELEKGVAHFIEAHKAVVSERDQLIAILEAKQDFSIEHKTEKLAVLRHFQTFIKPVNPDFHTVITDIIEDIEAIKEAA